MLVMAGWVGLGVVAYTVIAFPLGMALGRYLKTRQPQDTEESDGR